jgi:hypothetical protein
MFGGGSFQMMDTLFVRVSNMQAQIVPEEGIRNFGNSGMQGLSDRTTK